jgi:hypothetical protein
MRNLKYLILTFAFIYLGGWGCKEVYTPPAIKDNPDLLVVDGIVISGNDSTIITLSRTRSLVDSAPSVKELGAQVSVVGGSGVEYPFIEQGNGRYFVEQLLLDTTQLYQLKIITANGNEFRSALNNVHTSPPIDSVYWNQDSSANVHIYLNTHDPSNNTKYYRWTYEETWVYRSKYPSYLQYISPGNIILRPLDEQINACYQSHPSSTIEVATTSRLSSDIVNKYDIATVPAGTEKISERYSNLVKQYAISEESYNFWQNLKKNTEQLGTLFDLQPFTELGNIQCMNDPGIKCIGYISFSTQQEKRIFINSNQVYYWNYYPYYGDCIMDTIPPGDIDIYFQPPGGPYFNTLIGTANGAYLMSSNLCVDCRDHGGTTVKPPYWP